jgi:hypothetical protein
VRDPDSTSYVAAIESAQEFGDRLYTEAWRRGWSRAAKKVVIADGAVWIWNLASHQFPGAIQIVDLYLEAGCKTVIGTRLKRSGMFWTVRGANAIIALRCSRLSGRFEDYWASRLLAA